MQNYHYSHNLRRCCALLSALLYVGILCAQTNDAQTVINSLNISSDTQLRIANALSAYEKMKQAGRYVNSISEIITDKNIQLPIGIKSSNYTLCIEEIYSNCTSSDQKMFIKALCVIPTYSGNSLTFEGTARIDGEHGVGTEGRLELIAPVEEKLGNEGSLIFRDGTSLTFDCDGFREVNAKVAFILTSDDIYSVDDAGRDIGKLMVEAETSFTDINDFALALNTKRNFCHKGLDGFIFSLQNLVLDHSTYSTPSIANFPNGYFGSANPDESRNNWQGLAIANATVMLPPYMARDSTNGQKSRPLLSLANVLIDGNGFSATTNASNVIPDNAIDPLSWDISVSDFHLAIERNAIYNVGFGGKVNIPPFGNNSLLPYLATYDVEHRTFTLQSSLGKSFDFPLLCAKLTIDDCSTISLTIGNGGINPTINASGLLSVNVPIGKDTADSKLLLPSLRFEGMQIGPDIFNLGTASLTGTLETPSMAGFKLTLNDIKSVNNADGQGLNFNANVAINDIFKGDAGIAIYGDTENWKFSKTKVDKIHVSYNSNAFSVDGGVEFRDGDELYGKGFRGDLKFELIKKFKIDAVGVFGRKDGYKYFLTDVFHETQPAAGIPLPPALSFYGFGGGLYHHMQQGLSAINSEFGKSLTGISYTPDKNVGMGFLARTKFGFIGSSSLFDADVNFEMQFNNNWGVNFIQLRGEATMLSASQQSSILDGLKKSLSSIENKHGNITQFDKSALDTKPTKDGALTATVGMKFDMANDIFTADLKAYLDVAGVLTGRGDNNCMGWANAYFASDKWYTYIGTPDNRLGIKLLKIANAGGYFMVGNDIPELPDIPNEVKRNLSQDYLDKLTTRSDNNYLLNGKGLAFGSDLSVNLNAELIPFYAKLGVGLGTEMLLKQYGEAVHCKGLSGRIGVNGWYAQAQAWAWVNAAIGMKVKLFRKTRKFDILSAEMATFMRGAGPDPFYFTGAVGGRFNILGGLIKGHCSFDFSVGEKCEIVGGSPFGEDVITQLTPDNNADDVNVFVSPQLVLNIPAYEPMAIEDENGRKETYRIGIAEFSVSNTETGSKTTYTTSTSDDGRVITYDLDEPLESNKHYKAYAKVTFERQEGNTWVAVPGEDGKPYYEEKTIEFTSGERPKYILPEHVIYAYPADRQFNFLSKEYDKAYLMTSKNYSYLFTTDKPDGYDQKVQFSSFDGNTTDAPFSYKTLSNADGVKFEIDIPIDNLALAPDHVYSMTILNVPQRTASANENITDNETKIDASANSDVTETKHEAQGNLVMLEATEIYSVDFKTSSYNTFPEKMKAFKVSNAVEWQSSNSATEFTMHANLLDQSPKVEAFDMMEYDKDNLNDNLIKITPDYANTRYYTEKISPLLYENKDVEELVGNYDAPDALGVVTLNMSEQELSLLTHDIEVGAHSDFIYSTGTIDNLMQKYMNADYNEILTRIANHYTQNGIDSKQGIETLLKTNFLPRFTQGKYPMTMRYTLPGKNIVTSEYTVNLNYEY